MNSAKYAIVFKTHFWDDFVERQFNQLVSCAGTDDVFVLVDETHGVVRNIPHRNVVRITEAISVAEGYLHYPVGNLFWYNTDYQLYHFIDLYPEYDYIVTSEFDCFVNFNVSSVIEIIRDRSIDFVGHPIVTPGHEWEWVYSARPYYGLDTEITGRLLCFAIFSRSLALQLRDERLRKSALATKGEIFTATESKFVWPNNEAFVGTEIVRIGIREAPLSEFVDVSHYDWSPPYYEPLLDQVKVENSVIHPVLTGPRYIRSIRKINWKLEDVFIPGTYLHQLMLMRPVEEVVELFFPHFVGSKNFSALRHLRVYAEQRGVSDFVEFNMLKGKPATQSSTCVWSCSQMPAQDAARAVSGTLNDPDGFHTDHEEFPWWCVDLEFPMPIRKIHIYNRLSHRERANSLSAHVSLDMLHWTKIYAHDGRPAFGGSDGNPLVIDLPESDPPTEIRFIRLQLNHPEVFHLQQVEAYL